MLANSGTPILSETGFKVCAVHNHLLLWAMAFVLTCVGVDWPISPGWSGHLLVNEIPLWFGVVSNQGQNVRQLNVKAKEKQVDAWSLCNEMIDDDWKPTQHENFLQLANFPPFCSIFHSPTASQKRREMTQSGK